MLLSSDTRPLDWHVASQARLSNRQNLASQQWGTEMGRKAAAPKVGVPEGTFRPPTKLMLKGYPRDWAKISRRVRFERANGLCEHCGKRHGEKVLQGPLGSWQRESQWYDARGRQIHRPPPWPSKHWWRHLFWYGEPPRPRLVKVVLHTAHLDHNPGNCEDTNLAALCQQCHLRYDAGLHKWTWGITRDLARGQRVIGFVFLTCTGKQNDA